MSNHEKKEYATSVHVLMAFQRVKDGEKHRTTRQVIRNSDVEDMDLKLLERKCELMGGIWRIHRTVNARDTEKARKWLIHKLIDFPEGAGFIDSLWRTALLQPECIYGDKKFLLDIDTKEHDKLVEVAQRIPSFPECYCTPGGWHYVTYPFDTRKVLELPYVSLQRDGYFFIKKIGE